MMKSPRQAAASREPGKSKACGRSRGVRQCLQADQHRNEAEGDVDGEQPAPRPDRKNAGGDGGAEREGGRHDERVVSEPAALQAAGIDEANQRGIHAHDAAGAEPLQHARDQQAGQ
jgi:hypothetical protein